MRLSTNSLHTVPRAASLLAIAGLVAALGTAPGCDRRTPSAKAVTSSSAKLHTVMSPAAGGPGAETHATKQYKEVVADVADAGDEGLPGESASAKLLAAESQLGLSEPMSVEAMQIENEVSNRATVLQSVLSSWLAENSRAQAASLYDPTKTIADADQKAKEFDAKAQSSSKTRDDLGEKIKQFQGQAKGKFDQASTDETAIAGLREQAATVKATEAAKLIEQAAERRKSADKIRTEGSLFEAQAEQLQPQFREAELLVQQYQAQARTYRDLIKDMQTRDASKKEEVSAARTAAGTAASELDALVLEIAQTRAERLDKAYSAATQAYQTAATSISAATREDPALASAKITEGNIKQGLGDVHWARAQGLMRYESMLSRLADVQPALPNSAKYGEDAKLAKEAAAEALNAAKDAYEGAAGAYRGAKVRGEAKEKVDLLGSKLEAISQITAGQGLDALASLALGTFKPKEDAAEPSPSDETGSSQPVEQGQAVATSDEDQIRDTYANFVTALNHGDAGALASLYASPRPELQPLIDAQLTMVPAYVKLERAVKTKFGKSLNQMLGASSTGATGGAGFGDIEAFLASTRDSLTDIAVTDTTATASAPGGGDKLRFVKVDGQWKMSSAEIESATPENIAQAQKMIGILPDFKEVFDSLAASVEAGEFADENAFEQAFGMKMMPLMMKAMQAAQPDGDGGSGGGGG